MGHRGLLAGTKNRREDRLSVADGATAAYWPEPGEWLPLVAGHTQTALESRLREAVQTHFSAVTVHLQARMAIRGNRTPSNPKNNLTGRIKCGKFTFLTTK